jgi:hypothetical protein
MKTEVFNQPPWLQINFSLNKSTLTAATPPSKGGETFFCAVSLLIQSLG